VPTTYTLEVEPRTVIGKQVKALRRADLVPAVIYGLDQKPLHVTCPRRALDTVLQQAGSTSLIHVSVGGGKALNTLVREVQRDKIKRLVMHVDFLQVDLTRKLRTEVQLNFVNLPKLVGDVMLSHNLLSISVECLPTNIPNRIDVDCSKLANADDKLTVADLPKLEGVEYIGDLNETVVRVESLEAAPEEEEAVAEGTLAEPELVERGKKEEEEEDE
jgi:large subunit ribosomal protein L25